MKKLILFSFTIFISINLLAQKPMAGDNQIVMGLRGSNTGFLILKHYYKDDMAKRYAIGGNGISYNNSGTYTFSGHQTKSYSYSMNTFISYGIQKSFAGIEKLEPYIGIDYSLNVGMNKNYSKSQVTDTSASGYGYPGDFNLSKNNGPTKLTLNFRPLVGFNYYIKNFAIGIEYSLNLFYAGYSFPSSQIRESQVNGIYRNSTNRTESSFTIGSSFSDNLAITVSYFFRKKSASKPKEADMP
jgi:hypothetical protein